MTMAAENNHEFRSAGGRTSPQPMSTKMDLPHALRALRKLLADKDDTVQVFEIMRALNGGSTANWSNRGHSNYTTAERCAASQSLSNDRLESFASRPTRRSRRRHGLQTARSSSR